MAWQEICLVRVVLNKRLSRTDGRASDYKLSQLKEWPEGGLSPLLHFKYGQLTRVLENVKLFQNNEINTVVAIVKF